MDIVTDFQSGEDVVILALASDERESDVHYQTILTGEGVLIEYFHQDQMSGLVLLQAITTIQPEDVLVVA